MTSDNHQRGGARSPSLPPTPISPRTPMGGHSPYGSPRASPLPSRRSPSPRRFDVGFAAAVSNLVEQAHTIADHDRKKPYGEILRAQALGCCLGCYADGGASRTPPPAPAPASSYTSRLWGRFCFFCSPGTGLPLFLITHAAAYSGAVRPSSTLPCLCQRKPRFNFKHWLCQPNT